MNFESFASKAGRFVNIALLLLVYWGVSAAVMDRFMRENGAINLTQGVGFDKYLQLEVRRPFAYRVLVPTIVGAIEQLVTPNLTDSLRERLAIGTPLREYMNVRDSEPLELRMSVRYHIGYFLSFGSLVGLAFALRALALAVTPDDESLANFSPIAFIILLPLTFLHGGFLYDFPELLLLSLCFLLILKDRRVALCAVMFIGILNKESNVVIPLFYVANAWKRPADPVVLRNAWPVAATAIASFSLGKYLTHSTDGGVVSNHLIHNLQFMLSAESWFLWFRAYGGLIAYPRGYNIILLAGISLAVAGAWQASSPGARRMLVLAFCMNMCLVLAFGNVDEMRNWSLFFVPLFLFIVRLYAITKSGRGLRGQCCELKRPLPCKRDEDGA